MDKHVRRGFAPKDGKEFSSKDIFEKYETGIIGENGVIFDKKVNIPANPQKPTYLTINYTNLRTIHNDTTLANVNILNNLSTTPIHETITNIRA